MDKMARGVQKFLRQDFAGKDRFGVLLACWR